MASKKFGRSSSTFRGSCLNVKPQLILYCSGIVKNNMRIATEAVPAAKRGDDWQILNTASCSDFIASTALNL